MADRESLAAQRDPVTTFYYRLPASPLGPPAGQRLARPVRLEPGRYVCGDHRDTPSIQGALGSGRRAASAVLADRRTARNDRLARG